MRIRFGFEADRASQVKGEDNRAQRVITIDSEAIFPPWLIGLSIPFSSDEKTCSSCHVHVFLRIAQR
jgi:hypothetical protein